MRSDPLVSVIVNNYNYARFLPAAIDGALAQAYPHAEVVVVDDGSTDDSREVIAGYGGRVVPVLKANGGQSSAFNAGFAACRGEVVIFLDADDALDPTAAGSVVRAFAADPAVVKVHYPLRVVEGGGRHVGRITPGEPLPEGDLRREMLRAGPDKFIHPPTSGNAFARSFLDRAMPLPEVERSVGLGDMSGDAHLSALALLYGRIARVPDPQGSYRIHGANGYSGLNFDGRLRRDLLTYDHRCRSLADHCRRAGAVPDVDRWNADAWLYRLRRAAGEVADVVPEGGRFVLIDGDQWGMDGTAGRRAVPFTERGGRYWGPPAGDAEAVRELERLRADGATSAVVAWTAFWWLDHYAGLRDHLDGRYRRVLDNDRLVIFDLRPAATGAGRPGAVA